MLRSAGAGRLGVPARHAHHRVSFCGEREDVSTLVLSTKAGPVSTGLAAADEVAVVLVQPERVDGQVALEVGLLVDSELDLAVLDGLGGIRVQVEGGDLRLAAGVSSALMASRAIGAPRVTT